MVTVFIIIGLLALSALWFFIGVLFAKRNPGYTEAIDDAYIKGRTEAEKEIREKLKEAEAYIKSKRGSVGISPVSGGQLTKYLLRFGVPLAGVFGLVWILKPDMIDTGLYKCCLVFAGYILAELIWAIGYKRTFDRQEKEGRITDVGRIAILVFRGLLLGAVILGLTLGL
jgi:hypothetical protein